MPIASYKPNATLPTQPNLPTIEPKGYQSVVRDDKRTPLNSLIAYVDGAPWTVDYYGQLVTKHNDLREIDPGQSGVYQQYQKIVGMELRVGSPLSSSYDSDTGITTVTGEGLVYPFMIPNVSDYFVTETGDNQKGIFRITAVDRRTFNTDSVYSVQYELVAYVSVAQEMYSQLNAKSVRTYFFSKDRLVEGLQPMVREEEHDQIISLKYMYKSLVTYYFKNFFNRKFMTILLPGQEYAIYDSFLVEYLLKIVDTFDAPEIRSIKQIPTDRDVYMKQPQFWEIMLNRDYEGLAHCNQEMGLVSKYLFSGNTYIQGAAFSNIQYFIYPVSPDVSREIDFNDDVKMHTLGEIIDAKDALGNVSDLIGSLYVTDTKSFQTVYKVLMDEKYVLSDHFYSGLSTQSVLEILTKDYLTGKSLDLKMLSTLVTKSKAWGRLEQFYYIPILLTLIKEADRSTYS